MGAKSAAMAPAGYMLKHIVSCPSWIRAAGVHDIVAVSGCVSKDFADYIDHWRHNGYWLFNRPSDMDAITVREGLNRSDLTLFYYEVYQREFDDSEKQWLEFAPEASFVTMVEKPAKACLEGFDVVSFSTGQAPECSPLSCNALADTIDVNEHCLFTALEDAKAALESGKFDNSEPGPFRIFAVYRVAA